jgi:hypothetical protein
MKIYGGREGSGAGRKIEVGFEGFLSGFSKDERRGTSRSRSACGILPVGANGWLLGRGLSSGLHFEGIVRELPLQQADGREQNSDQDRFHR